MNEIIRRVERIEERLEKLEKSVFQKNRMKGEKEKTKDYEGLTGGIHLLINNKFFSEPKKLSEVITELKRENYHYGIGPIAKALSVGFTKKKKLLTRFKDGKNYKYVIRK